MGPRLFAIGDWVRIHSSKQNNLYEVESVRPLDGKDWVYTDDGSTLPADALELVSTLREREEEASLGDASIRASLRAAGISAPEPEEGTPRKPEPAEPLVYSAAADIPERFQCSRCDDSDDAFCAEHTYWSTKNAEFQRFWREFNDTGKVPGWAQDTPRKPEPGDQVRVKTPNGNSFEGTYVTEYRAGKDQVSVVEDDCILTVTGHPKDLVWEVIEPARPAVPEEPEIGAVVMTENPDVTFTHRYNEICGWVTTRGSAKYSWVELNRDYTLYAVERGAVIGGE